MMSGDPSLKFHQPHVPENIGELQDLLGMIMLSRPTFLDQDFQRQNIDTVFAALNLGIESCKARLGGEAYLQLLALSDEMKGHFLADPDDTNGRARAGRALIHKMDALLKDGRRR